MTQTLIGADSTVMTLSGSIKLVLDSAGNLVVITGSAQESPLGDGTLVLPGGPIAVFKRPCILDVEGDQSLRPMMGIFPFVPLEKSRPQILDMETLSKPGRPLVNVERDLAPQHCCFTRGHLGPHNWQDDIGEYDGPLDWQCEATRRG